MSRTIAQIVGDVMDDHDEDVPEETTSQLGGLLAELTGGPRIKHAPDDDDGDFEPELSDEDQADIDARRAADPDALPEGWDEAAEWESLNHEKMQAQGLDDQGEPLAVRDPETVERELETAVAGKTRGAVKPMAETYNNILRDVVAQDVANLEALAKAVPEFEEDPAEHVRLNNLLTEGRNQLRHKVDVLERQSVEFEKDVSEALPYGFKAEAKFREVTPDYTQALDHLHSAITARMRVEHPGATDAEIGRAQAIAALQHIKACKVRGGNPAEELYHTACQLGFKGAGPQAAPPAHTGPSLDQIGRMNDKEFNEYFSRIKKANNVVPATGAPRNSR